MTAPDWERSIWYGTTYGTRQARYVLLDRPSWIFSCPACEYRMTATSREGVRAVRRLHVRTVHRGHTRIVEALDEGEALPRHLTKDGKR